MPVLPTRHAGQDRTNPIIGSGGPSQTCRNHATEGHDARFRDQVWDGTAGASVGECPYRGFQMTGESFLADDVPQILRFQIAQRDAAIFRFGQ